VGSLGIGLAAQAPWSCYTDLLGHYPSSKPATINRTGYLNLTPKHQL